MALRGNAATFTTGPASSVTLTHGISIQSGDIILLSVSTNNSATLTWPVGSGFSPTLGTTTLSQLTIAADGSGGAFGSMQGKVAGPSEPASYTISASPNVRFQVVIWVYSGRNSAPFAVAPVTTAPVANSAVPLSLALSTLSANSGDDVLAVIFGSQEEGNATDTLLSTAPTGFGNIRNDTGGTANPYTPMIWSCDKENVTSGSLGSGGQITGAAGAHTAYGAYLISMAAAADAAPPQAMSAVTGSSLATRF